jgi:glyoxylase I family protein
VTIRLLGIDHVVIRAVDVERMVAFYCGVLGCSLERAREDLGLYHLRAGAALIDLVSVDGPLGAAGGVPPGRGGRNMDHLCLRVEPFDESALREWLAGHGVATGPARPRFGAEGSGPSLYIADPEGNAIELKGPPAEC